MIRNFFLIILILLFNSHSFIAQVLVSGNPNFAPAEFSSQNLDESRHRIFYEYTYVRDSTEKSNTKSSLTVLQVGENFSKFTDFYSIKLDSVLELHSDLKKIGKNEINVQLNFRNKIAFKPTVIRNLDKLSFTIQSRVPSNYYEYSIEEPDLNWKLEADYKSILGFKTQKATVTYSGRRWVAWFAEAIPINLGPYVFGNLPGLIVELYDEEKNFHFIANGIQRNQEKIYLRNEKRIIKTTQRNFFKTEKSYHERPGLFLKGSSESKGDLKKIPYNPIELAD